MNQVIRAATLALGLAMTSATAVLAQAAPGPVIRTVLAENERFLVVQVTSQPGSLMPWHSHKAHTIYAVTDVNFKIEEEGKAPFLLSIKKGEARVEPAVRHQATNATDKAITMIVTEEK